MLRARHFGVAPYLLNMALDDYDGSTHIFQAFYAEEYETGDNFSAAHEVGGFHRALVILDAGHVGLGGTVDTKLQESNDAGVTDAWADVPGAAFPQVDATNEAQAFAGCLLLGKRKKYLRIVMTLAVRDSDVGVIMVLQPKDSSQSTPMSFSV